MQLSYEKNFQVFCHKVHDALDELLTFDKRREGEVELD